MAGQNSASLYQVLQPQLSELNQMCTEYSHLMEHSRKSNSEDVTFDTEHWRLAYEEKQSDILEIRHSVAEGYKAPEDLRTKNEESVKRYLKFISRYSESACRRAKRANRDAELAARRDLILSIILDIELTMDTKVNKVIGDLLHAARVLIGLEGACKNAPRRGRGRPCHSGVQGQVQGRGVSLGKRIRSCELLGTVDGVGQSFVKRRRRQDSNADSSGGECSSGSVQVLDDGRPSVIRFAASPVGCSSEAEGVAIDGEVNLVSSLESGYLDEVHWEPICPGWQGE